MQKIETYSRELGAWLEGGDVELGCYDGKVRGVVWGLTVDVKGRFALKITETPDLGRAVANSTCARCRNIFIPGTSVLSWPMR